ncbi:Protein of unknown function [Muriicola jejuensis]|uniref:DUF2750 domain-containing protein n=1 Tax=Muriicola jejuensis TaxID=504488 RepID=A0A6P0UIP2_9FLAO|nr:DUF2750 domain-containing protein [Muriicola jejuensis]NER11758.1 DUF2750 domain-containing protein [Muriicola jejuensis]SMP26882.1 Protein of unknown function [Muriicola jejuensis]
MFQDHITVKNRHKRFIKTICETEVVYGLEDHLGFATSSSVHYEDEEGKAVQIICFWAEKTLAKSCIKDSWAEYKVSEIPLTDFIENWCIGMGNDGLLVGTQFDKNMFGFEVDPFELIIDLTTELKSQGKDLNLLKFNGISDLEKQVKTLIN